MELSFEENIDKIALNGYLEYCPNNALHMLICSLQGVEALCNRYPISYTKRP